jgi:endonuclease/exonuclease/phosphatase (EEP) superfamily protein YafD
MLWALPLAAWWNWRERYELALANGFLFLSFLALVSPAVFSVRAAHPSPWSHRLRVATANVFIDNSALAGVDSAFRAIDADVLGITEFSDRLGAAMTADGLDTTYPYRVTTPTPPGEELAIYSRYPIVGRSVDTLAGRPAIDVTIDVHGTKLRTILVHTLPPMDWQTSRVWQHELAAIGTSAATWTGSTVVFGDFNANRWHADFRRVLTKGHLKDAQELVGKGLSVSWPMDWPAVPPFARLDHVLVKGGVVAIDGFSAHIPGSDHKAVVADLAIG